MVKGGRLAASFVVAVSVGAVAAWGITRLWGISWIDGLEESEAAQFTDTACAALGAIAAVAAAAAVIGRRTVVSTVRLGVPAMSVGAVALIAMLTGTNHSHAEGAEHSHDATETVSADAASVQPAEDEHAEGDAAHSHTEEAAAPTGDEVVTAAETGDAVEIAPAVWPRAWQPDQPIDLSGVPGVTAEQQLRSTAVLQNTLERLPQFADVRTIGALGFTSIGDSGTGYEHYINPEYFDDEHFLDPDYPESLVYRVNGAGRTLVSAMFMAGEVPADDPELVDYGGPLMTWHVHNDLCFSVGEDGPRVAGLIDDAGNCPEGTFQGGNQRPMVARLDRAARVRVRSPRSRASAPGPRHPTTAPINVPTSTRPAARNMRTTPAPRRRPRPRTRAPRSPVALRPARGRLPPRSRSTRRCRSTSPALLA